MNFFISRRFWTFLKTVPNALIFYSVSFALGLTFVINAESCIHLNRENTFFPQGIVLSTPLSKADRRMLSHTYPRKSSKVVKGRESNLTHLFPIAEMPFYKVQSCIGCRTSVFLRNNRYQSSLTIRSSHQIWRNFQAKDIKELLMIQSQSNEFEVYFFFSAKVNGIHTIIKNARHSIGEKRSAKNNSKNVVCYIAGVPIGSFFNYFQLLQAGFHTLLGPIYWDN